ncbi:MAG: ribonucleoside triphosphate reductase, partial [Burkholderiales bacterium]
MPQPAPTSAVRSLPPILKRDGTSQPFDGSRILSAITRAGAATREFDAVVASTITKAVVDVVAREAARRSPTVEAVQDLVERTLIDAGYVVTARAYIVYREQHKQLREDRKTLLDVSASMDEYLDQRDWRVNANANQGYSLGGLILNVAGKVTANYWLNHVYPHEVGVAHREGDIHLHDLDMLAGYCAGWSLRMLLAEGLNGVPGRVEAAPPKHLSSAVGQIVNFLGTLQNEWAGAQAFSSFDTYMAPFVRKDGMSYDAVRQCIQELIYNLNVPSRWGSQTPFTNLTFDWVCPDDLRDQVPVIAGEEMPFTYGDLGPEMEMINRAYIEVMVTGDAKGRVFTFPIPTYNITSDFPWDSPLADALFEMTAKYGLPYFQNFVKSDLRPNMIRSMCCRLQLDLRELLKRGNGLFGSAEQTGSLGVVTLNCARLGHLYRGDEAALLARTDALLEIGRTSLEIKRKVIQRHMDNQLFPYTK